MSSRFVRGPLVFSDTTIKTSTGNVPVVNESVVIVKKTSGAATTVTLPGSPLKGRTVYVKDGKGDAATNAITVSPASGTIDGASSYVLNENYGEVALTYGATEWHVLSRSKSSAGLAGAVNGDGAAVSEAGAGGFHQTTITFTDYEIPLTDEAGVIAHGGEKVYDLPLGHIMVLGAVTDIDLTKDAAGVDDTWDGDFAVGTVVASNNNSLSSTEANIIPSTATPQAEGGATTADGESTVTEVPLILDGSSTAADVYLNFLVDDLDHDVGSTATNLIVNGTLTLTWINLGDN